MDLGKLRTDLNKETDGVWFEFGDGARVKVAMAGNPNFSRIIRALSKPYTRQINNGTLDDDIAYRISGKAMAEAILLDWEDIIIDGDVVTYSKQVVTDILCNRQYDAEFRKPIQALSEDVSAYRQVVIEDAEKNSQPGLLGV
jgi:hypothetical protein